MKFTPGQITFLTICLLAALYLDFYLGARFGPELFWDIRLDRLNRETLLPEETPSAELEALLAEEAEKITFHQVLENNTPTPVVMPVAEAPMEVPPTIALDSPPLVAEKALKKAEEKRLEEKKEVAKKVISEVKPEEPDQIAAVIEQKEPLANYTLQVGSFSDSEQADAVRSAFISRGYSAFVKEVSISGKGKWYRVHVGKFSSEKEALKNQGVINQNYKIMPLIVKM